MVNIKDFTFSYNKSQPILDHLSFDIDENHFIAILGNNGAGKSTLLKCMNGIQEVSEGTIYISGEEVLSMHRNDIAKRIAYVAQKNRSTRMTVFDSVLLGRKPYIKWDATKEDISLVESLLNQMHLEKIKLRYLDELSGGEVQKVMLARALAQEPKLLLLDEPTSNLDPKNQHEVLSTLKKIAKTNHIALAIVIHDLNLALRYCDRFLFMKDQKIYSYGDAHTMTPTCIEDVYGINASIQEYQGIKIVIPLPENESLT